MFVEASNVNSFKIILFYSWVLLANEYIVFLRGVVFAWLCQWTSVQCEGTYIFAEILVFDFFFDGFFYASESVV